MKNWSDVRRSVNILFYESIDTHNDLVCGDLSDLDVLASITNTDIRHSSNDDEKQTCTEPPIPTSAQAHRYITMN